MNLEELYLTAELAKLELKEAEAEILAAEVGRMLEYFSIMSEIDVEGLEPTVHTLQKTNRTRPDSPLEEDLTDKLLENAPERDNRFIIIPNVL